MNRNYVISLSFVVVLVLFVMHRHPEKPVPVPEPPPILWLADGVDRMNAVFDHQRFKAPYMTVDVGKDVEFGMRADGVVVWRDKVEGE